jgi:hypothetical protein
LWLPSAKWTLNALLAAALIDVDGDDHDQANNDELVEGVHAHDDKAGSKHDRYHRADEGAGDRCDATKEARPADDGRSYGLQVVVW